MKLLLKKLKIKSVKPPNLNDWKRVVSAKVNPLHEISMYSFCWKICTELKDSYKSIK